MIGDFMRNKIIEQPIDKELSYLRKKDKIFKTAILTSALKIKNEICFLNIDFDINNKIKLIEIFKYSIKNKNHFHFSINFNDKSRTNRNKKIKSFLNFIGQQETIISYNSQTIRELIYKSKFLNNKNIEIIDVQTLIRLSPFVVNYIDTIDMKKAFDLIPTQNLNDKEYIINRLITKNHISAYILNKLFEISGFDSLKEAIKALNI